MPIGLIVYRLSFLSFIGHRRRYSACHASPLSSSRVSLFMILFLPTLSHSIGCQVASSLEVCVTFFLDGHELVSTM